MRLYNLGRDFRRMDEIYGERIVATLSQQFAEYLMAVEQAQLRLMSREDG
jgi:hypothetical protein